MTFSFTAGLSERECIIIAAMKLYFFRLHFEFTTLSVYAALALDYLALAGRQSAQRRGRATERRCAQARARFD